MLKRRFAMFCRSALGGKRMRWFAGTSNGSLGRTGPARHGFAIFKHEDAGAGPKLATAFLQLADRGQATA